MKAVNLKQLELIQAIISPKVKIVRVSVQGKWLIAELSSNINFMVKNE